MKESITGRVGRIVSGSLHALVNAVEGAAPDAVMQQAIREIDGAIDEVRAELGRVAANKHLATQRLSEERRRHQDLEERIGVAVKSGRDDLAEVAIASQLDIEAQIPVLEDTIARLAGQERKLEGYATALKGRKREMAEDLRQIKSPREDGQGTRVADATSRADSAQATFTRLMQDAADLTATATPGCRDAAMLAELEELARANRIKERLQAIKSDASSA